MVGKMLTPITDYQAKIYKTWQQCQEKVKLTAKSLGIQPEQVRATVARVKWKLSKGKKLP